MATVAPGESLSDYDILVTGHSLGGALATLFTAEIAEYGIDAGRSLPQKAPSEPWWTSIANTVMGKNAQEDRTPDPPRPKSLRMYNFGSPRVGDSLFAEKFELLIENGSINQAYRIVNSQDIIARVPRPMLNMDYEHCGRTVLIEEPLPVEGIVDVEAPQSVDTDPKHVLWIEGESDFIRIDPVRDYRNATRSPTAKGTLLDELFKAYKSGDQSEAIAALQDAVEEAVEDIDKKGQDNDLKLVLNERINNAEGTVTKEKVAASPLFAQLGAVADRLSKATITDIASIVGIDRTYATRELQIAQSFLAGEALAHHMEDSYYSAMGRTVGLKAAVGEEIVPLKAVDDDNDDEGIMVA